MKIISTFYVIAMIKNGKTFYYPWYDDDDISSAKRYIDKGAAKAKQTRTNRDNTFILEVELTETMRFTAKTIKIADKKWIDQKLEK